MSPSSQPTAAFAHRILLGSALILGLVLLLWGVAYATQALLLTFAAVLAAIFLRTLSGWVQAHTPLSEGWALAVVVSGLVVVVTAVVALSAPLVGEQIAQLRQQLPEAIEGVRRWMERQPWSDWLPEPGDGSNGNGGGVDLGAALGTATGIAATAAHVFLSLFILIFVTLYLAIDPRLYTQGFLHLVPLPYRPRAAAVLAALGVTLRFWLFGTLLRMVAVGLLTFVGLWALGVPLALVLAIAAGLLDFVPYFGPIIAAAPAILVAFAAGPELALYVLILYVVVQQIESLIISPVIYQQTVYLPPVITILGQILLFSIAGVLGGILATPLVAVALVMVKMLYVEQALGDDTLAAAEHHPAPDDVPPLPGDSEDGPKRG